MEGIPLTVAGVGFLLGLRHALDPDHVAAVSTIATEEGGLGRSSWVGTFWGLGHGVALLLAGGALLALKLSVPDAVARWLEGGIAIMLMLLGARAIRNALRDWHVHAHRHRHDGTEHVHFHAHRIGAPDRHEHAHRPGFGVRPFLVGVAHGLAGSAGLSLLALGAAPSLAAGLAYIAMLGLGAVAGMALLTGLLSLPLALLGLRYGMLQRRLQLLAGAGSFAFGLWLLGVQVVGLS